MKEKILAQAVRMAATMGYDKLRRDEIARRMGIAAGGVTYHFKDMPKLRSAVIKEAIASENLPIIAQALTAKHPLIKELPDALRRRALLSVAN